MKRDPIVIFVGLFLTVLLAFALFNVAHASEVGSLTAQLGELNTEYNQLNADRAQYAKKAEELKWAAEQLAPKIPAIKAEDAQLKQRGDALESRIQAHNAQCSGTFDDEGFVAACNGRKAQLDAESARYQQLRDDLGTRWDLLKEALTTHDSEVTLNNFADQKAYNRQVEIHNMAVPIINRLKEIAGQNDRCKNAIQNADVETMHAVCGEMFDGNQ